MKNKGFWFCMGIYFFMFLVDLWSTLINGDMVKYLEVNPLYKFGGLWLIGLINILFMILFWYIYTKSKKPYTRFCILWGMTMIIITRIIVAYQNYQVFLNPPDIETVKNITYAQKTEFIFKWNLLLNFLPMLQSFFTYAFFKPDHKIEVKE